MNELIKTIVFSNIINDIIVLVFIIWLVRKFNLLSFIGKRRGDVIGTIKDLEREKKLKEQQLEQTKNRVKNVDQEVAKMHDDAEKIADELSEKIVEEAEKEAVSMQKKAQLTIESERKVATNEVIKEITGSAFALAEVKINQAIDSRLHQKYIDNFINNLEGLSK